MSGDPVLGVRSPGAISRGFDAVVSIFNAGGSLWIFLLMIMLSADVFSRAVFNAPINGVPLLVELSILVIVFMQLAAAISGGRLTRSEILLANLLEKRPTLGLTLQAAFDVLGLFVMGLLFYYTLPTFIKVVERSTFVGVEGDFALPSWPFKLLILIGAAFCAIQFVRSFLSGVRDLKALSRSGQFDTRGLTRMSLGIAAITALLVILGLSLELSNAAIGVVSIFFILGFVYVGVHVGVALAIISFVGVWMVRDNFAIAGKLLALSLGESMQEYEFGVIPLFVLMGQLISVSGVGRDTYEVAHHVFRKVKGGLGTATVGANAIFAAVTGTSIASASVFTKVAVPEMLRLGYRPRFCVGVVAGSSVLGMLIPPSLLLIIFGILAEVSIGDLFIAGIIPGLVLTVAYFILISIMANRFPDMVGSKEALDTKAEAQLTTLEAGGKALPILILIVVVLGGIFGGIFTATEAGGIGALGALVLAVYKKTLTRHTLWEALTETGHVTAAIAFLLVSAHIYSRMISLTGIPNMVEAQVIEWGLSAGALIAIYIVTIIILGTILDAGSIMLLTVPLMIPIIQPMGVDLVWFGIVTIIGVEIGLLTPPLGLACFVIHNNLQDDRIRIEDVFWGAAPFAATMLIVLLIVVFVPDLATLLVR